MFSIFESIFNYFSTDSPAKPKSNLRLLEEQVIAKGKELMRKSSQKSKKVDQATYSGPARKPKKYTRAKLTDPPTVKRAPRNKPSTLPAPNFEGITPLKSTPPEAFTPQSMAAHHAVLISTYQEVMNKERECNQGCKPQGRGETVKPSSAGEG